MSLFPAYASEATTSQTPEETTQSEWLTNSSFQPKLNPSSTQSEPKTTKTKRKHRSSSKGRKHRKEESREALKKAQSESQKPGEPGDFYIDRKKSKEYLTMVRIDRNSRPEYKIKFHLRKQSEVKRQRRKLRLKRYFNQAKRVDDVDVAEVTLTKDDLKKAPNVQRDENYTGFTQEQEMSQSTASFNRQLAVNSHDIDMWLKYIQFQDAVFQHEKTYKKGSMAKGQRVTADRKLAIVDKALTHNPGCERLLRERLNISVSVYPSDELQLQLGKLVAKDQGNIILWQGFIESTQCSMSHCNTPAVLKLYNQCLSTLHQLRRNAVVEKSLLEEYILRMLYQCGLFLKQSGLFEQLWTLLRLYLELNLSPPDKQKFNITSAFEEKQLVELEEVVLNSQLPIHELWLRVEKLRESCHWLPYTEDDHCEDPQRLVFPDDVAELIHPITMPGNTFKLTATILTLLKTPLMHARHTTLHDLGLDYVPWAFDSVESLLPLFLPGYPVDLANPYLLKDMDKLAIGPQYLKVFPGQQEYLEFLLKTMKNCVDCLSGREQLAITVWWLKFHRLLIRLAECGRWKMSAAFRKRIKATVKNLLKEDAYRNNLTCYQEYALIEYELGNKDACVKVLETTIAMHLRMRRVTSMPDDEKSAFCAIFRTLIELALIAPLNNERALKYLVYLATGKNLNATIDADSIAETAITFKHVTLQLLGDEMATPTIVDQFLPHFVTDWLICHGWFVYVTQSALECGVFVEQTIATLESKGSGLCWQKEVLMEFYTCAMLKECMERPGTTFKVLDDVLQRALTAYPNNLFLLTVLARVQTLNCSLGQPWWRWTDLLVKSGRALSILFLILIANQRIVHIEDKWRDTITGARFSLDSSHVNRMLSLFKKVTSPDVCTRRCGLIWRLYLQFLHANFDLSYCRKAYYIAVEECPWLKALYIDAAIYIPAELPQIQDLLLEKQLRLHVTPEELEILRN